MLHRLQAASALAFTVALVACYIVTAEEPSLTLPSPTGSHGEHGVYRWAVKIDHEAPPDRIPADHRVKPSDLGKWPEPRGKITTNTPRSGRELEWWQLTGRVLLAKVEDDGDLHLQLCNADDIHSVQCVVEVPVKQAAGESPWDEIRTEVFGWSRVTFPLRLPHVLVLTRQPVVTVEGKAFFDAQHRVKSGPPNRRVEKQLAVWELHPCAMLKVISK